MKGILYLIPTSIGNSVLGYSIPSSVLQIINSVDNYIVESEKEARRFLISAGIIKNIGDLNFFLLNEHSNFDNLQNYLLPLKQGKNMGLISDAGCPAVADPGSELILLAHKSGIRVVPLVGPSSIILSLMASGLIGQSFCFLGYLPVDRNEKSKKIKEIEKESFSKKQTQIFIEAPYRNQKLFDDLLLNCKPETLLSIACDITLPSEYIMTMAVKDWKMKIPQINKRPAVFLLLNR